jgi:hypothetical protein
MTILQPVDRLESQVPLCDAAGAFELYADPGPCLLKHFICGALRGKVLMIKKELGPSQNAGKFQASPQFHRQLRRFQ